MLAKPDIATQITSRICHDLVSPIGAISNGLELLALSGAQLSPELALISESVEAANAKLRFLRIAFGEAKNNRQISATEIKDILVSYYNDPRITIQWSIKTSINSPDLRVLFLTLLCVEKIAPYGGQFIVQKKGMEYILQITGSDLKSKNFIDFKAAEFYSQEGPSLIQFDLLQMQLDQMGYTMSLSETSESLTIKFTP